jgi:hypothetical protein
MALDAAIVYDFHLKGITSLLMHADSIEGADELDKWRKDPRNKGGFSRTELTCQNNTANGGYIMKRFVRRMLSERGIQLWSYRDVGLSMLNEHDQIFMVTKKRAKRAKRQHKANFQSLVCLSNDRSAKINNRDGKFMVAQMEILQGNISHLDSQIRATEYNSRTEVMERPPILL